MSDDDDSNPFGDSSDDEEDDFFHSYKTSTNFHKRENNDDEDDSSPPKRARKQVLSATDTALDKLQRRRERNKHLKALKNVNEDDDDDSDVEIVDETTTAAAAKKKKENVEFMDSSDDDEKTSARRPFHSHAQTPVVVMQRSGVAKNTCDKIIQARNARLKLQQAQQYHAEDCHVPEPPLTSVVETINVDAPCIPKSTPQKLGPSVPLVLRTTHVMNGKRSSAVTMETMSIGQLEPLQNLMEQYQQKHTIVAAESSVKFSVNGQRLDLVKTPKCCHLQANDIINVLVTTLRSSNGTNSATTTAASTAHYGPPLRLNMRTLDTTNGKPTSEFLSIRVNEPLEHLLSKYTKKLNVAASTSIVFKFDGETMNMKKTPKSYDMEDEDIIDVVLK